MQMKIVENDWNKLHHDNKCNKRKVTESATVKHVKLHSKMDEQNLTPICFHILLPITNKIWNYWVEYKNTI